jgi:hypothetical protein
LANRKKLDDYSEKTLKTYQVETFPKILKKSYVYSEFANVEHPVGCSHRKV